MTEAAPALIEQIGEDGVRAVVRDFYDRVVSDLMIGFLFARSSKERLIELECQLVTRLLGGTAIYQGRSMREAHRNVRILDGHFARRLQILRETLADHDVAPAVREAWIAHTIALKPQVISSDESCMALPSSEDTSPQGGRTTARE